MSPSLAIDLQAELGEIASAVERIRRHLGAAGVPEAVRYATELAAEEVLVNIAMHGSAPGALPRIRLDLTQEGGVMILGIDDDGPPFDPIAAPLPVAGPGEFARGGRGLRLLRGVADALVYRREDGRNRLEVRIDGSRMCTKRVGS